MGGLRQDCPGSRADDTPSSWDSETFPRGHTLPTPIVAVSWKASVRAHGKAETTASRVLTTLLSPRSEAHLDQGFLPGVGRRWEDGGV